MENNFETQKSREVTDLMHHGSGEKIMPLKTPASRIPPWEAPEKNKKSNPLQQKDSKQDEEYSNIKRDPDTGQERYEWRIKVFYSENKYKYIDIIVPIFDRSGPQWDKDGNLKSNIEYTTGEYDYRYKTDDQGRIIFVEADNLKLTNREKRLDHNPNTPGKQEGDDAGHLIGDRFGGSPDIDNLVSQLSDVNKGEYKKLENEFADAIKRAENVQVKIEVVYEGGSSRPSEIIVNYKIGDGDLEQRIFPNNKPAEGE
jgi:hypothetical protein